MAALAARVSPRTRRLLGALVLFAVPLALFVPHLAGSYMWDDLHLVRDHPLLKAHDGWWRVFATELLEGAGYPKTQFYHPIPLLSLWLQFRISDSFAWLRFANVLFHSLNVLLFARVLERIGFRTGTVVFAALAFAMHPLAVEPVMLVCGRHDTIAVNFALLALCIQPFDGAATQNSGAPERSWAAALRRSAIVAFCVLCAFISKEAMVAAAPVAFVYMALAARLDARVPWKRVVTCVAPFVGLLGAFAIRQALAISASSAQASAPLRTHVTNLGTIFGEYARYILTFSHGTTTRIFVPYTFPRALGVLAAVSFALALAAWASKRTLAQRGGWNPGARVLFGLLWACFGLGPHILSMPIIGMWGNRYGYFPTMGLLIAAFALVEVAFVRLRAQLRTVVVVAAGVPFLVVASNTAALATTWRDGTTVFGYDVATEPENYLAFYHYGVELERVGGCAKALPAFQESGRLAPSYWRTMHNIAGCLIRLGRYEDAIKPAKRAVLLAPTNQRSAENLALAQWRSGHAAAARRTVERGLQQFPASAVLREIADKMTSDTATAEDGP